MKYVFSAILILVSLAAWGQESGDSSDTSAESKPPSVEDTLDTIGRNANYIANNLSKRFSLPIYTNIKRDGDNPKNTGDFFLKTLVDFSTDTRGSAKLRWPYELSSAAYSLKEMWRRSPFLGASTQEPAMRKKFFDEVQYNYEKTLSAVYVWIEYIRRQYLYGKSYDSNNQSYINLIATIEKVHEQAQSLLGAMGRLRLEKAFSNNFHWEQRYAKFFHAGKVMNPLSKSPQSNLLHYFAPALAPDLVPAMTDDETILDLMSRHPEIRDSEKLKTLLEKLKKERDAQDQNNAQSGGNRPGGESSPVAPPTGDQFKDEPAYIKDNEALQMKILALQFQAQREDLSLDNDLKDDLTGLKTELEKIVGDYANLASIITECKTLLEGNEGDYTKEDLQKKLAEILTGPKGLRPGYPALKPQPPSRPPSQSEGDEEKKDKIV